MGIAFKKIAKNKNKTSKTLVWMLTLPLSSHVVFAN